MAEPQQKPLSVAVAAGHDEPLISPRVTLSNKLQFDAAVLKARCSMASTPRSAYSPRRKDGAAASMSPRLASLQSAPPQPHPDSALHGPIEKRHREQEEKRLRDPEFKVAFAVPDVDTSRAEAYRNLTLEQMPYQGSASEYSPRLGFALRDPDAPRDMVRHFHVENNETMRAAAARDRGPMWSNTASSADNKEMEAKTARRRQTTSAVSASHEQLPPFQTAIHVERAADTRMHGGSMLADSGPYVDALLEYAPRELDSERTLHDQGKLEMVTHFHATDPHVQDLAGNDLPPPIVAAEIDAKLHALKPEDEFRSVAEFFEGTLDPCAAPPDPEYKTIPPVAETVGHIPLQADADPYVQQHENVAAPVDPSRMATSIPHSRPASATRRSVPVPAASHHPPANRSLHAADVPSDNSAQSTSSKPRPGSAQSRALGRPASAKGLRAEAPGVVSPSSAKRATTTGVALKGNASVATSGPVAAGRVPLLKVTSASSEIAVPPSPSSLRTLTSCTTSTRVVILDDT